MANDISGFTIRGYNRVQNKLRALAQKNKAAIDPIVRKHAEKSRIKFKSHPYPPIYPIQQYRRTGRLANSWRKQRLSTAIWEVFNNAPYAGYVMGADSRGNSTQATTEFPDGKKIFVKRWDTTADIYPDRLSDLTRVLTAFLMEDFR